MRARFVFPLLVLLPLTSLAAPDAGTPVGPPASPKKPVTETYFGEKVVDPWRWLEDWNNPAVQQWSEAQNAYARRFLDALAGRQAIEKRVTGLSTSESPSWGALQAKGGKVFALERQPPKQQPFLVVMDSPDALKSARVLVDPNALDASGATTIDWFQVSEDGKYVAVSLSKGGTESGDAHVYRVADGKALDVVPRVNSGTAGGSLAWKHDDSGFWYTRHPAPTERPKEDLGFFQQVYFHPLGADPAKDAYSIGKDFPRVAETELSADPDGGHVLALVQKGDGGEYQLFLLDVAKGAWTQLADYDDEIKAAEFGPDKAIWALSRKHADNGKLLRIPLEKASLKKAKVVVPEQKVGLEGYALTPDRLFVDYEVGGPTEVQIFTLKGKKVGRIPAERISTVYGLTRSGRDLLYANQSYLTPPAWYRYDTKTGKVKKTALAQKPAADFSDVRVVRETCTSKDGTKVPVNLLLPKGVKRDGKNPTYLTGYGGFAIPITPRYHKLWRIWLDQGGIIAEANLRGGTEFGEAWHRAGAKLQKQHVFDDFIGCAEHLVKRRYTQPSKLGIEGGSNGGLLMGAVMTQRPDLFGAVVARVGYFDMLRFETKPNGAFNNTEYGSVKNEAEYKALRAYSPYQHVQAGKKYPPALFLTGANDPRVDPMHSRKMVAALQSVGAPAYLRTSSSTGHGLGAPLKERIAEDVDIYTFLLDELGVHISAR